MKKISCAILGYGDRGSCYGAYANNEPEELEVVAIIDVSEHRRQKGKEDYNLQDHQLFDNLDEFLAANITCDVVINSTMDQMHYETTMKLLDKGYNVLLEKPVTGKVEELLAIRQKAEEKNCEVIVCHVLRYTPYYSTIKQVVDSGRLGKIMNIQLNEHVWHGHFVNAFVRGKWRSEKECGSGLLLAKCCHDTDLMCWLNNVTTPVFVSSFGSKSMYTEANAPEGATQYCYECPHRDTCMFNAEKFELEKDFCPQYTWADTHKPWQELTEEEKREFLKKDTYGQCVYKVDMDIVDRQCVSVEFANGSVGTLNLVGGASKAGRHIHIICEFGEIVGYVEDNKVIVRTFDQDEVWYHDEILDLSEEYDAGDVDNSVTGHYGGDYHIMKDLVRYLNGEGTSVATTVIQDSVNSHLICYAAEKARKEKVVVNLKTEY
ncbi:MAG: Gfo/Idh/MocA family oxidoreductase [Oscillospiraceae bacterium]|nr:Gfo/Idh/MocA family oxidoreductase [Oscillospiraceae bacterium]